MSEEQQPIADISEFTKRVDFLARIKAIRAKLKKRDDKLKELDQKHRGELIKLLEATDLDSFHGTEHMVYLQHHESWKTPKTLEQKKKFFEYVRGLGEEQFYTWLGINSQALQTFCKEQMVDAEGNPRLGFEIPGIEPSTVSVDLGMRKK